MGAGDANSHSFRADWIAGAELSRTCKMALSMAPQAFISTIDNALYALTSRRSTFRAASAADPPPEALPDAPFQIQTKAQ